jgi:hypothetical protein
MGMNGTLLTNRPEEKAAEATESARTYHQKVGSLARVYEVLGGRSLVGDPFESDPWRNLGDKGSRLVEGLLQRHLDFVTGDEDISRVVAGVPLQHGAGSGCLRRGPLECPVTPS